MIKVVNELVDKRHLSAAQAYADFGIKQVDAINSQLEQWLEQQPFVKSAPSPQFDEMRIRGNSNDRLADYGETPDRVEWDLRFRDSLDDGLKCGWIMRGLADGLLHIKRLPDVEEHNSAPGLFNTLNYIQVSIRNGERGWVERGIFPINIHIEDRRRDEEEISEDERSGMAKIPLFRQIPVFTDTKRDAEAGFRAAREWAKFRTMAVACSEYVRGKLKIEWDGVKDYVAKENMRFRSEKTLPLMLEFLPDTRVQSGLTALHRYYQPGVLESTAALELEKGKFCTIHGQPIEVSPIPGKERGYDAVLYVDINTGVHLNEETARGVLERELQKYFDVTLKSPSELKFRISISNAHKVRAAIYEGAENTPLHTQTKAIVDAAKIVYGTTRSWRDEQLPVLQAGYGALMKGGMEKHFEGVEQKFLCSSTVNPLRKK